jgi:hypothetical protein
MGMFDYISVNNKDFVCIGCQTKSLDSAMNEYLIKDGELLLTHTLFDKKLEKPIKVDYTGEVRFYDYTDDKEWIEFVAFVENGDVLKIIRLNDE